MRYKSNELREQRVKLVNELRELDSTAKAEDRDLTSDEVEKFDRIDNEIRSLEQSIEREERLEGFDAEEARSLNNDAEFRTVAPEQHENAQGIASDEYRDAFSAYLRGDEQRTALQVGQAANGGYAVAESWANQLIQSLEEMSVIRSLATVYTTATGGDIHLPTVDSTGSADQTAELGNYNVSEPTLDEVVLKAYKITQMVYASEEILQDSIFDVDSFVRSVAAKNIALKEGNLFSNGGGTTGPQGIFVGATVGKTAAAVGAITGDELIDLFHEVAAPYRANASWLMADATIREVRKLKDDNEQYLWQPGLSAGQPDLLLGRPVYAEPSAPVMATANKTVVFGDVSAGYAVRDAGPTVVKFRDQQFGANDDGRVAWAVRRRTDGRVADSAAIRTLQMKTS